jgi:hypothetical protein
LAFFPVFLSSLSPSSFFFSFSTNLFFQTLGKFNQNASREEKLYQQTFFPKESLIKETYIFSKPFCLQKKLIFFFF